MSHNDPPPVFFVFMYTAINIILVSFVSYIYQKASKTLILAQQRDLIPISTARKLTKIHYTDLIIQSVVDHLAHKYNAFTTTISPQIALLQIQRTGLPNRTRPVTNSISKDKPFSISGRYNPSKTSVTLLARKPWKTLKSPPLSPVPWLL